MILTETNEFLKKKCEFYEKNFKSSFQNSEKHVNDDLEIVLDPNFDSYKRVENSTKDNFVKKFTYLTIITVMIQFCDLDFEPNNSSLSNSFKLKTTDVEGFNFFEIFSKNIPVFFYFLKCLFFVLWVFMLVVNRKKIFNN